MLHPTSSQPDNRPAGRAARALRSRSPCRRRRPASRAASRPRSGRHPARRCTKRSGAKRPRRRQPAATRSNGAGAVSAEPNPCGWGRRAPRAADGGVSARTRPRPCATAAGARGHLGPALRPFLGPPRPLALPSSAWAAAAAATRAARAAATARATARASAAARPAGRARGSMRSGAAVRRRSRLVPMAGLERVSCSMPAVLCVYR